MSVSYTPMLEQYREIKKNHPQEILFFRLGDFYEMFFDDAELASRELEITLTSREGGQNTRVPMCGIPYHAAEPYLSKLINKGYKIAICEQMEDPKQVKGLVRREVVKIITPGTVLSENLLPDQNNNFLAVISEDAGILYLAAADISTGECLWASFSGLDRQGSLCDQLFRLMPSELVLTGRINDFAGLESFIDNRMPNCTVTTLKIDDVNLVQRLPEKHFAKTDLPEKESAYNTVGYLLYYLNQTVKNDLSHINRLVRYNAAEHLVLDAATLRNLEITRNMRDGSKKGTVFSVLDFTQTAMGGRLLRKWLEYPLLQAQIIISRQDAITSLLENPLLRQSLHAALADIYDFERILTRIEVGTANARDLIALKNSLSSLPRIKEGLAGIADHLLKTTNAGIRIHQDVVSLIENAIVDTPPFSVREGGLIKEGYDFELDELRNIARDSKRWIQDLEMKEREATGIKSMKIGYNKVFGYYLEVTHTHAAAVPAHYIRKQTLANAERYITPELKEFETKVLGAQEKIVSIEYHLFSTVREYIKDRIQEIQHTARQVAQIDVLTSLSEAAARYNYVKPVINNRREIVIRDGRHPVVERLLVKEMFVPNDTLLNHGDSEIMIITGPNMAGKSTYMRQVAVLALMAQIGSFIPAREASFCPVDRVFTRVGASDDLATGQSTFMVEMNEVAQILKHATQDSLIILDEIGRGTSTFDGMSIAKAVIEYVKTRIKAKTLFATHYHELTELAELHPGVKNYSVAVKERGNDVIFLRRIVPGGADKSYGIHVAQLAGLPKKVIERAQEILNELEQHQAINEKNEATRQTAAGHSEPLSLFTSSLTEELVTLDVMTITPLEAINILYRLQNQAKQEAGQL